MAFSPGYLDKELNRILVLHDKVVTTEVTGRVARKLYIVEDTDLHFN